MCGGVRIASHVKSVKVVTTLRLKTNLTQRILLMFVFLLGSYVVFTSIYRFRIFLQYTTDDIPYSLADGCAWNVIEISSGIISTCLPTLVCDRCLTLTI